MYSIIWCVYLKNELYDACTLKLCSRAPSPQHSSEIFLITLLMRCGSFVYFIWICCIKRDLSKETFPKKLIPDIFSTALCTEKLSLRALYSIKRALHSIKRALYHHQKSPIFHQKSPIFHQKSPAFIPDIFNTALCTENPDPSSSPCNSLTLPTCGVRYFSTQKSPISLS